MSGCRKFAAVGAIATAFVAFAVAFTSVASGASSPFLPSASISVHANPGQVTTRLAGMSCGGHITIKATGARGASGKVVCGLTSLVVPAGTLASTYAPPGGTLVCQANALFAPGGVDVVCKENVS
jgi:hypothetical protein